MRMYILLCRHTAVFSYSEGATLLFKGYTMTYCRLFISYSRKQTIKPTKIVIKFQNDDIVLHFYRNLENVDG